MSALDEYNEMLDRALVTVRNKVRPVLLEELKMRNFCACVDQRCLVHKGRTFCSHKESVTVFHAAGLTATEMCAACAKAALESGEFTEDCW